MNATSILPCFRIVSPFPINNKIQEAIQSEHRESVTYEVIKETGPSHDKHFVIKVVFDGITLGIGEGSSKKRAEQMAAKEALSKKADK